MAHIGLGHRQRLAIEIENAIPRWCSEPFVWGVSDCLLGLADIINNARGFDPAAEFRGRYSSMMGAARITRRYGGFAGALESAAIAACWGRIDPHDALIGDIGVIANDKGPRCGVIKHHKLWLGRVPGAGFATVPTSRVLMAWRVN